jgi:amidase
MPAWQPGIQTSRFGIHWVPNTKGRGTDTGGKMSRELKADRRFYAFSPENRPAMTVEPGEELIIEAQDCFSNQIQSKDDVFSAVDWDKVNPATGPVFVTGAEPGDTLVAHILEIRPARQGVMTAVPGLGALGHLITDAETKVIPIGGGEALFSDQVQIPLDPMIGVIGTAPREGSILNGTPGPHGGNMDCTLIREDSRVYLPVEVPGALFGLGDLHAVMGDGEIVVCGVEMAGWVRLRLTILKGARLPLPMVENEELVATVHSHEDLDLAAQGAIESLARLLTEKVGLPLNEAGMLMSVLGQLRVCQVVDPLKTCRMEFPKWALERHGFAIRPPG